MRLTTMKIYAFAVVVFISAVVAVPVPKADPAAEPQSNNDLADTAVDALSREPQSNNDLADTAVDALSRALDVDVDADSKEDEDVENLSPINEELQEDQAEEERYHDDDEDNDEPEGDFIDDDIDDVEYDVDDDEKYQNDKQGTSVNVVADGITLNPNVGKTSEQKDATGVADAGKMDVDVNVETKQVPDDEKDDEDDTLGDNDTLPSVVADDQRETVNDNDEMGSDNTVEEQQDPNQDDEGNYIPKQNFDVQAKPGNNIGGVPEAIDATSDVPAQATENKIKPAANVNEEMDAEQFTNKIEDETADVSSETANDNTDPAYVDEGQAESEFAGQLPDDEEFENFENGGNDEEYDDEEPYENDVENDVENDDEKSAENNPSDEMAITSKREVPEVESKEEDSPFQEDEDTEEISDETGWVENADPEKTKETVENDVLAEMNDPMDKTDNEALDEIQMKR